ncbi:hypothetical protein J3F83DRAFT_764005 [Trichoderma novae-zelandiae]
MPPGFLSLPGAKAGDGKLVEIKPPPPRDFPREQRLCLPERLSRTSTSTRQGVSETRDRWRESEKAVDERVNKKGTAKRATKLFEGPKQAPSALLGFVAGSPVCPLSARPLSSSHGGPRLPSNPGATLIHPRRAGTPTPSASDPCRREQALRWTPSSTPSQNLRVCVLGLAPSTKYHPFFLAAELPRTIRETAVCKPASLQAVRAQLWSRRRGGGDLQLLAGRRLGTVTAARCSEVPDRYLAAGTGTLQQRVAGEVAALACGDGCWGAAKGLCAWPGPRTDTRSAAPAGTLPASAPAPAPARPHQAESPIHNLA